METSWERSLTDWEKRLEVEKERKNFLRNCKFSKNKVKRVGLTKLEIDAQCLLRAQAMPGQEDEVKNTENKWRNKYLIEQTACV